MKFILFISLLFGLCPRLEAEESWVVGKAKRNGKPVIYKLISELPAPELREKLPWLTVLAWKYDGSQHNGMPPEAINQRMIKLEDQLETIAGKGQLYIDVYTSTGNDLKEFVFHISDRDLFMRQLNLALKGQPRYPLDITFYQDPNWADVANLLQDFGLEAKAIKTQTAQATRCEISGSWRHADKPASLLIDLKQQLLTVQQHEQAPQAVGLTVIRQLQPDPKNNASWYGQMYDGDSQDYVPVMISAQNCKSLAVSNKGKVVLRLTRDIEAETTNSPH